MFSKLIYSFTAVPIKSQQNYFEDIGKFIWNVSWKGNETRITDIFFFINVLPNKKWFFIITFLNHRTAGWTPLETLSLSLSHTNFLSCLPYSISKFGQVMPQGIFQFNPIHQLGINRNTEVFWFYPQSQSAITDRIFVGDNFC